MSENEIVNSNNQRFLIANDYITFELRNKLEVEDLSKILTAADRYISNSTGNVCLYVDVTELKEVSIFSRRLGVEWIKNKISKLKIAVYTSTIFMYYFVSMIITGTGAGRRMRIFKSKEEALAWLNK